MAKRKLQNSTQEKTKMSTENPTSTTVKIEKTYKYFDLETLESKSETRTIEFTPATDSTDSRIQALVSDEKVMLKVFNSYLRSEELAKAENEVTSKGGKRAVVLSAVKPFRALPPFNAMYVMDGDKPKVENGEKVIDRPRQTKAILDMIKLNPVMIQSIKEGSAAATDSDADENDE